MKHASPEGGGDGWLSVLPLPRCCHTLFRPVIDVVFRNCMRDNLNHILLV